MHLRVVYRNVTQVGGMWLRHCRSIGRMCRSSPRCWRGRACGRGCGGTLWRMVYARDGMNGFYREKYGRDGVIGWVLGMNWTRIWILEVT